MNTLPGQMQRYSVTLDFTVMDDFDPYQIDWEDLFSINANETVSVSIKDLTDDVDKTWQIATAQCHWSTGSLLHSAWQIDGAVVYFRGSDLGRLFISAGGGIKNNRDPNLQRWQNASEIKKSLPYKRV